MKKIIPILLLSIVTVFSACNKDEINNTEDNIGVSRVTRFPTFHMTGNDIISVVRGTTFTDPGITATEGTANLTVTTTGTVNTNVVGIYTLTYSATNKDGFSGTATRTVIVIPVAESTTVNLSGTYKPVPQGNTPGNAVVTKVAPGVYYTTNCWGGGSTVIIPAYFICTDGVNLTIPRQTVGAVGRIESVPPHGTYDAGTKKITWTVSRLDFTGGPLTLEKVWQKI